MPVRIFIDNQNIREANEEKAASLCIGHKSLKIKTARLSVTLGTGTGEAELVTSMTEKAVMQDTQETDSGMLEDDLETMETGLI